MLTIAKQGEMTWWKRIIKVAQHPLTLHPKPETLVPKHETRNRSILPTWWKRVLQVIRVWGLGLGFRVPRVAEPVRVCTGAVPKLDDREAGRDHVVEARRQDSHALHPTP